MNNSPFAVSLLASVAYTTTPEKKSLPDDVNFICITFRGRAPWGWVVGETLQRRYAANKMFNTNWKRRSIHDVINCDGLNLIGFLRPSEKGCKATGIIAFSVNERFS